MGVCTVLCTSRLGLISLLARRRAINVFEVDDWDTDGDVDRVVVAVRGYDIL